MIVDIFTHVIPKRLYDRFDALPKRFGALTSRVVRLPTLVDMDARMRLLDPHKDYGQVISLSAPPVEEVAEPALAAELARIGNDEMAELVRRHPGRFLAFVAAAPMNNVDAACREVRRAVRELGAVGVQLYTDAAGKPIDASELLPLFDAIAAEGVPIWLHPTRGPEVADYPSEEQSQYDIWQCLGWPYMTAVALWRLALIGLWDRHPGLRMVTHHQGGMIPFHPLRVARAMEREAKAKAERTGVALKRAPMDYIKALHHDTAMGGAPAPVRCGLELWGADHVVFATDSPYNQIQWGYDLMNALDLDAASRRKIEEGNARALMEHGARSAAVAAQ
jgi:aminocarboxymuconate-semialdehyde decarboxylase